MTDKQVQTAGPRDLKFGGCVPCRLLYRCIKKGIWKIRPIKGPKRAKTALYFKNH